MSMDYSLYGEDNLSISFWGMASEYRYTVKNDVLTLIDLSIEISMTPYWQDLIMKCILEK